MIKASIIGATGYTGAVLTDILSQHPGVEIHRLTSKSYAGKRVAEVFPRLRVAARVRGICIGAVAGSDVAFVCYPHAESHPVVAELVEAGCRVVDLSADFRLKDPLAYKPWYGFDHPRHDLVKDAVFGLPEKYRAEIKNGAAGGQSWVLSDCHAAQRAARGGRHRGRRSHSGLQVRRVRGRQDPICTRRTSARSPATSRPTAR